MHVVYVSPLQLSEELVEYYQRLLCLNAATGEEAPTAASSRFTIVVPELSHRFPRHATLAALALYSPACLRRVRQSAQRQRLNAHTHTHTGISIERFYVMFFVVEARV